MQLKACLERATPIVVVGQGRERSLPELSRPRRATRAPCTQTQQRVTIFARHRDIGPRHVRMRSSREHVDACAALEAAVSTMGLDVAPR